MAGISGFINGILNGGRAPGDTHATNTVNSNLGQWSDLVNRGQQLSNMPWDPSTAKQIAGYTPDELAAFTNIRGGISAPYLTSAAQYANQGAGPVSQTMSQYYNPWQDQVVGGMQRAWERQDGQDRSRIEGQARQSGQLASSDRVAVAQQLAQEGKDINRNNTLNDIYSKGFTTAAGLANQDASRQLQASGIMGSLIDKSYTDTNALLGIGQNQRGWQQSVYDANTQNAAARAAQPYQSMQWYAGLLGSDPNRTTTQNVHKDPGQPNPWAQWAGLVTQGLPYAGQAASWATTALPAAMAALADGGRVGGIGQSLSDHMGDVLGVARDIRRASGGGVPQIGYVPQWTVGGGGIQAPQIQPTGGSSGVSAPASSWGSGYDAGAKLGKGIVDSVTGTIKKYNEGRETVNGWANNDPAGSYDAGPTFAARGGRIYRDDGGGICGMSGGAGYSAMAPELPQMQPAFSQAQPAPSYGIQGPSWGDPSAAPRDGFADGGGVSGQPSPVNEAPSGGLDVRNGGMNLGGEPSKDRGVPPQRGALDRFTTWSSSTPGTAFWRNAGASMMDNMGGPGSFLRALGRGIEAGDKAEVAATERESQDRIAREKMRLAQAAHDLQVGASNRAWNEDARAAAMAPYERSSKKAAAELHAAQAAAARKALESPKVGTADLGPGHNRIMYDVNTGKKIAEITGPPRELGAHEKKAIDEADDNIKSTTAALSTIKELQRLNGLAYDGVTAGGRAAAVNNLPFAPKEGASATVQLQNMITSQALQQLKSTFGAAPTEGERKILLDIQGAANNTAADRKLIFDRAHELSNLRLIQQKDIAKAMRAQTYYTPGGQPSSILLTPNFTPKPSAEAIKNIMNKPHMVPDFASLYGKAEAARAVAPEAAIRYLRDNPGTASNFESKYNLPPGTADAILRGE